MFGRGERNLEGIMIGTWHRYLMAGAVMAVLTPAAASAQGASWKHARRNDNVRQESRAGRTSHERDNARTRNRSRARDQSRARDRAPVQYYGRDRAPVQYYARDRAAVQYRARVRDSIVREWQDELMWERGHARDRDFARLMRERRELLLRRCERARSLYYQRYGYDGGWVISPLALQGIIDTRDLHLDIVLRALGGGFLSH
jgi:hypothetical protein